MGGYDGSRRTNKLFTLRQRQWIEEYPPMNTARSMTTVVSLSDGEYIIVIGGWADGWTATVELFQVSSRRWHQLKDLPQPLPFPSATICGNQLHVIGTHGNGYSCSLQALLSSDRPITSQSIPHLISWTSLPLSASETLNSCHSLWTASNHWWQARLVTSQDHSPVARWTVGGDWVYVL